MSHPLPDAPPAPPDLSIIGLGPGPGWLSARWAAALIAAVGAVVFGLGDVLSARFGPDARGWATLVERGAFVLFAAAAAHQLVRRGDRQAARAGRLVRALAENSTDAVFVKDRAGRYLLFNDVAARLVGRPAADVLGRDDRAVFDAESAARLMANDRRIVESGAAEHEDLELRTATGTRHYMGLKAPYRDETGAVVGVIGVTHDASAQKLAEESVRESAARLAEAQRIARAGSWEWEPGADRVWWSEGTFRLFGLAPGAVAPSFEAFMERVHPDDRPLAVGRVRAMLAGGGEIADDLRYVRPDGSTIWVHSRARTTRGPDGSVVRVEGTDHDVTEQKKAEEAVRASERRFRELADAIPQIVWTAAPDGALTHLNRKGAEFTGRPVDDLKGWSWEAVIHPADAARTVAEWRAVVRDELLRDMEFRIRRADGTYRWHISRQVPTRNPDGSIAAWFGTCTDVEDLKQAEASLREERDRLATLTATAPAVIYSYRLRPDGTTTVPYASPGLTAIFGIPADQLVADAGVIFDMIHPDDIPRVRTSIERSARTMLPWRETFRVLRPVGAERWVEGHSAPAREPDGGVVWHGFITDVTDRKRDEAVLRFQHALLKSQTEASPDGVLVVGADRRVLSYNRRFLDLFGVPEGLVEAGDDGPLLAFVQSRTADPEAFAARVAAIYADPDVHTQDEVPVADGRTLDRYSSPVRGADGATLGRVWHFRDITERRRAADAVLASEARLRLFAEHVPAPIAMLDRDLRYVQVSRRWLTDYRLGDRDLTGERHYDVFPDAPEAWKDVHRRCLAGEVVRSEEDRFDRADGTVQWLRWEVRPWADAGGDVGGIIIFTEELTQRKRLEAEQRNLLQLIEHSRDFIALADLEGRLTFMNAGARRMIGLAPDEDCGRLHFDDYVPEHQRALLRDTVIRTAREQGLWEGEMQLRNFRTGAVVDVFRSVFLIRDGGRPAAFATVTRDVTEQKRAEAIIRESEERHRRLVDFLPTAVFIHTPDEIVFCNPAFARLMGAAAPADLLGRPPLAVPAPEHLDEIRARVSTMVETGQPSPGVEIKVVRVDGRLAPVYSVAAPILDAGRPAVLVAMTDLSDRERSVDLLRSVLQSVTDAILTINSAGVVRSANPAVERLFGYRPDELVGANVKALMPESYASGHDDFLAEYLRTGVAKVIGVGREVEGRRRDGSTFPLELTVTEFRLDGERHFTGVLRDITGRKRLEAQFQQAQKMEAVGRLAGGVAHDFNNLLTVINGYGDLLLMDLPPDDPRIEPLAAIRDAGGRAARLTQQLLAFSRKAIVEPKVIDLNELVAESAKLLRRLIGEDVVLAVLPDRALPPIKADPGQIEQVVMNLVVNARDAMPRGGRVTIETRRVRVGPGGLGRDADLPPGLYARFSVGDTGEGIPDDVKAKIFEPFFTTKGVGKGTGLGLAVVHGVVKQCGGHIEVESKVGVGTTFRMLFPAAAAVEEGAAGPARPAARGSETILLVEDEGPVRKIARMALEAQGFKVIEAPGGPEALQLVESFTGAIDLLVTDVVMPKMGGQQLTTRLRELRPGLKVLFVSGYTDDAVLHHGVVDGTDPFLQKPFTPLGLARKVRTVIDGG